MKFIVLSFLVAATAFATEPPKLKICHQITLAKTSLNIRFVTGDDDVSRAVVYRNATKLYELTCESGEGTSPRCSGADGRGNPTTLTYWKQSLPNKKIDVGQIQTTQGDEEPILHTTFVCE